MRRPRDFCRYLSHHHQSACALCQSAWRCSFLPIRMPKRFVATVWLSGVPSLMMGNRLWRLMVSSCKSGSKPSMTRSVGWPKKGAPS